MRRENNHQTVSQSSIALLQERFRQLQTVKEMREEREQERAWSQGGRSNADAQCVQPIWFNHPELPPPSRPRRGSGPPCWPGNRGDHTADLQQALKSSLPMNLNLWPNQSTSQHSATCTEQDVDTTLHL
ncbi:hypothetical protein ZIOFF_073797 [Zingiber officinale]|uniref:Uncharacterized protein n=1 Tax=Zingiber officinale TaxID=94328 RepID=A0A8J5CTL9_ZINOF|nr:hypothetical protein ZIOFF_073797 [Zingiber officinale]